MILNVINHPYEFDMKNICTVFFPYEKICLNPNINDFTDENIIVSTLIDDNIVRVSADIYDKSQTNQITLKNGDDTQLEISVLLYNTLSGILNYYPQWGILFGVRPAKLMHRIALENGEQNAKDYFVNKFLTTPKKAALAEKVMRSENKIISLSKSNSFSIYVSIPFCPSRCSYCSFVSHSIERTQKLIDPYVDLICLELKKIAEISKDLSLNLETIYFGGGTPTTLSAEQLSKLFYVIDNNFDLSTVREYTVEAGRPDTVSSDKLLALKAAGIDRISINPQSFNDEVLKAIGRKHTVQETIDAFELARKLNFKNINMDFIAGLPNDTLDSFINSIDKAVSLSAESVTVHTLALKSASYMVTRDLTFDMTDRITVSDMVDYSQNKLSECGYHPYYMYRQSKSLGNLENVGFSKDGCDCLYNVFMMDETHSVFAAGAGAVTRLKAHESGKIERIYNYKYPYEYIDNFENVLNRKMGIYDFYAQYK